MKKFLTILLLLATMFPFAAKADQLTVCDGTNTNAYVPVYGYYADACLRAQMVYPADMLADMAGASVSGMKFYATQSSVSWTGTFQVYVAEVASATISSFINPTTATTVHTGTLAIAGGEMVVTFDAPFNYAGGNLLIGFDQTVKGNYATSTWNGQNTTGASVQGYSYSSVDGILPTQRDFLPKVTFEYIVSTGLTVEPTDLGTRPNGAWMEPATVEVKGGVYNVTAVDMDNDYFTVEGQTVPFTTPVTMTIATGTAAATGDVTGNLSFFYNGSKDIATFAITADAYDPTAGDVVETAIVVANPVGYTNTPTGIYHNYNLPGEASDGADAVYKLTFASDVMLDANVGAAANGKVALYPEGFNGEGGPMATNNYEYNGPQVGPGPKNIWFSYPYTGSNTFFGSSTSGMIFGYELSAEVIAAEGLAGLTLIEVESAAREAYPYDLLIMTGVSVPENIVYYQPMGTAAVSMSYFNLPLSEPYVLGEENTWIMFMTDSPYSAYCGITPVDAANAKIWYSLDLASWYTETTYTPEIYCHFLELPTGREMSMDLASMTVKANYAGGTMAEMTAEVNGTSKAAKNNSRSGSSSFTEGFENGLNGWTNIDADGDGHVWMDVFDYACYAVDYAHTGSHSAVSASYDLCGYYDYVAFDADNYLVSPQKYTIAEGSKLSFWYDDAEVMYGWPDYFEVCVSTAGNTSASDFTAIWTSSSKSNGAKGDRSGDTRSYGTWRQVEVDLSAYAGQEVYIAFHHQNYDGYDLWIDDVELKVNEPAPGMFVSAGTYYLVAQATETFTTSINVTAAPAPEQAVVLYPTDGMVNVEAPVLAEWILGNYTTEMQVLVGSQYPPQTALIDWTSELVESAFITDLLPNTTYFIQVNERNASGVTEGEIIGFTTSFEKPVATVATSYLYPGDAAFLSWEMNRSFRGYNVYADGVKVNEALITENEYAVEGLEYGSHTLNVTAVYDEGESAYSNDIFVNMTGYGHVAGAVFEQDGTTPIAGAAVSFIGTDAFGFDQTFTFTTANNGTFAGDVYEGSYVPQVELEGYQVTPGSNVNVAYDQTIEGLTFYVYEEYKPVGQVNSEITADNKANVWWDWAPATVIEDFEHDGEMPEGWNQSGSYGWEVTTNAPYEGTYCIKSSNAGIQSSTGAIEVTVEVPYDAKMSFYVKPSSESNYDKFYFYIDGAEKFNTSGAGSWTKKEFNVSAGTHTYKWAYTKDSSVNSNDDCIYVDYVTLFEKVQPEPPFAGGWIQYDDGTYASSVGTGSAGSNVYWAVCWPNASAYNGLSMTKAALYDAYAAAYTVNIYEGGESAPQTLIGTTTINGTGSSAIVEGTFSTPITIDGTKSLWIVGVCSTLEYPMAGCNYVGDPNSDLLSLDGATWEHAADYNLSYSWMLRGYLQTAKGDMVVLDAAERAPQNIVRPEITFDYGTPSTGTFMAKVAETPVYVGVASNYTRGEVNNTRSFQSYNVYRKDVLTDEYSRITSTADTTYVDAQWSTLPAGVYQYGVSATYAGNRGDRADRSELTVNDGTDYSEYIPVHGYYCDTDQENQFIIPASQLAAMSGSNITSMTFYLSTVASSAWNCPFEVRLMETAATTLDALASVSGATLVYTGTPSGTSSPMTITFSTPFAYNGGNLLVDFANTTSGNYGAAYFYGVNTTTNTAYFQYYDAWNGYWSEFPEQFLPKVTFTYEGGGPVPPIGNEEVTFSFDNDFEGWTVIDNDGDSHVWYHSSEAANHGTVAVTSHSGAGHVMGESYCNASYAALTPDDYMVAPEKYNLNGESQIKFYACAQDVNYPAEHFGVAVSTASNTSAADFTTIAEWTLTAKTGFKGPRATDGSREGTWYEYVADLSSYAGQEAWIAIRHFNCSDEFLMNVDDVTITYGGATPPTPTGDGESEIVWADPMDKDMVATVEVSAVTNNGQSVAGAVVKFENMVENLVYEETLDETGFVSFADFRKGYYTMSVELAGYAANMGGEVEIFEDKTYNVTLTEVIAPAEGLFASATGWVMWDNIGGDIPTPPTPGEGDEFTEGFESGSIPTGWTTIDADGDGHNWTPASVLMAGYIIPAHGGADCITSESYSGMALTPDNYLVTPKVKITTGSEFSFWACAQDPSYPSEHYGVAISTTTATAGAFTTIAEWTMTAKETAGAGAYMSKDGKGTREGNWYQKSVDLSDYAGQEVYIAIRHFNCTDWFYLNVDDAELSINSKGDRAAQYSIVMLDGVIAGQATGNWFQLDTDNLVEGQEYEVSVASVYASGMSEWRTTTFTYYSCENFKPGVKNLAGEVQGVNDVKLTWTLPGGGGSGDEFSFSFDNDLEGWTNIDGDGDGHVWYHSNEAANHSTMAVTSHSGAGHVMGESYCNATWAALTPNDFFVTPQQYNIGASSMLSFWACAQDVNYAAEHFGVAISTTGNTSASDFTTIAEWTLTAKNGGPKGPRATDGSREGAWYEYTCDLSEYAGQAAWIAIRHFNCSDQFLMCLDDVAMSNADGKQGNNREMWDLLGTFNAAEGGHYGVVTDGEYIYTSNWGYSSALNNFYKYDMEGNVIEGFNISGCGTLRGMTFDGQYVYGVANSSTIYCVDLNNHTLVGTTTSAYGAMRGITYDPARDGFWVIGNWSGNLTLIDRTGAIVQAGPAPTSASDLAYFADPDGVEHVFCFNNGTNDVDDYNIATNTITTAVFNFNSIPGYDGGTSGGCHVATYAGKTAFFGDLQQSPNLIGIYELAEGETPIEGDFLGAMIFRDGELITPEPLMANQMVDVNVPEGEHEYMARLAFGNAEFGVLDTMWYAMSCPVFATVNVEVECTPVEELEATEVHNGDGTYGINLEWICTGTDIQGYKVYRNNSYIGMTTTMSYYDDRTNNPGSYTYGVVAVYDYCESEMVTVDVTITGVEENDVVEGIYPNPTTGKLYIKAAAMQQITVANALGQVMMTETVSGDETMIDMSAFEAGVYMVRVATENGTTVKRVSVIK